MASAEIVILSSSPPVPSASEPPSIPAQRRRSSTSPVTTAVATPTTRPRSTLKSGSRASNIPEGAPTGFTTSTNLLSAGELAALTSPTAKSHDTIRREHDSHDILSNETTSRHFPPSKKRKSIHEGDGLGLEMALKRRMDWTPPKLDGVHDPGHQSPETGNGHESFVGFMGSFNYCGEAQFSPSKSAKAKVKKKSPVVRVRLLFNWSPQLQRLLTLCP
jgi:hypothetical protein